MKTQTTKLMLAALAAISLGAMAETTNTVKVTKFHQSYPYSGKATVEYTVGGTLPANAVAEFTISTDDKSATFTQKDIVTGANTNVIDFASSFDGALLLTNASFTVTIGVSGGVQLWENGPYWAECNVGATKPEEFGYYFWWGDTVGYKRKNDKWVASDGSSLDFSFDEDNTPTYNKDIATLKSGGWITADNVLVPEHDAAHVHWGGNWRMPTGQELSDLASKCTWTWTAQNGVNGYVVSGNGDYSSASIFLPAAGYGYGTSLSNAGSLGYYWSSVPYSGSYSAWYLSFRSSGHYTGSYDRTSGRSVRPVQGFTK